jgi:ankyrin repeat protein
MRIKSLMIGALVALTCFQAFGKGGTNTVVFTAAAQGDVAKLKEFFTANPKLADLRDELLCTSALNAQTGSVEFLFAQDANVNAKGFFEMTPLAHMAMYGSRSDEQCAAVAELLIAHGAEVDPVDQYGATPLLHAAEGKKLRLMRVLLAHGADPGRKYGETYRTPLFFAMRDMDIEMLKLLLEFRTPLDIAYMDENPLMKAVTAKNYAVARLLLEHRAKITPPRNVPGTRRQSEQYW